MKRQWVWLQIRFKAQKDFNLASASRRTALSDNASTIATFSSYEYPNVTTFVLVFAIEISKIRQSSVCLSFVTFVRSTQGLKLSTVFHRHFVP